MYRLCFKFILGSNITGADPGGWIGWLATPPPPPLEQPTKTIYMKYMEKQQKYVGPKKI